MESIAGNAILLLLMCLYVPDYLVSKAYYLHNKHVFEKANAAIFRLQSISACIISVLYLSRPCFSNYPVILSTFQLAPDH
ncbi:hypothetical protein GGI43DRAFT_405162, partial [Trichoderma evansii]